MKMYWKFLNTNVMKPLDQIGNIIETHTYKKAQQEGLLEI